MSSDFAHAYVDLLRKVSHVGFGKRLFSTIEYCWS
jgi:hypothetical protein